MAKKYKHVFYSLSEDEMQAVVRKAQAGDSAAQLYLLEVFQNFLAKYVTLLYHGRYDTSNYDLAKFIGLFIRDNPTRWALEKNKLSPVHKKIVTEAVRGLQFMVKRYGDETDVEQTVNICFLKCVSIYKKKDDIPFSGYIYGYFLFALKKHVEEFLISPLGRKTYSLISDDEVFDENSDERPEGYRAPPTLAADELIHGDEIDELWVAGDTAHGPFAALTVQERQLLKWKYVNRERSSDIAARVMEHPNTTRDNMKKIRKKLLDEISKEQE